MADSSTEALNTKAEEWITHYYSVLDSKRSDLENYFRDDSYMTWNKRTFKGKDVIMKIVNTVPFKSLNHAKIEFDVQHTGDKEGTIIAMVYGTISTQGGPPAPFMQTFKLVPSDEENATQTFWIANSIFRRVPKL